MKIFGRHFDVHRRNQTALDCSPTAILHFDRSMRAVYANAEARRLLRRLSGESSDIRPTEDQSLAELMETSTLGPVLDSKLQMGPSRSWSVDVECQGRILDLRVTPLRTERGAAMGFHVQIADATEKRVRECHVQQLQAAMDGVTTNIIIVDDDLHITYVNRATVHTLNEHIGDLRKFYPDLDPSALVGRSIDDFHQNPDHQRRLLKNRSIFPYETTLQLGPL